VGNRPSDGHQPCDGQPGLSWRKHCWANSLRRSRTASCFGVSPGAGPGQTAGRLWATDFGLAQVQSDARLTMTGACVGKCVTRETRSDGTDG
jgi:hypothetical protein